MQMVRMTEAELQQGFRALADRARREPVTITTPDGTTPDVTTPDGRDDFVVLSAEEYSRLKRRDRRVGLTEEWVEAVRNAKVPDEFAALDAELKWLARAAARARSGPPIRYSYLWHSEHLAAREEGEKDRPCAIVAALRPAGRRQRSEVRPR